MDWINFKPKYYEKNYFILMSLFLTVGAMAQNWTFEVIDIASNADEMLYTNAPCTNTQWGDQFTSWTVLFDDNADTFLHTEYAQNGKSEDGLDHYIRVDLGAGNEISAFKFDYTTRGGNAGYDFPQKFIIAGSNEVNGIYTEIGRIESGCPVGVARSYSSDVFTSETPYRYLRFMVTETNTNRKGEGVEHNYWHMGEFRLYKATPYAGYVHNTGNINRSDRGLTSFTITDGTNSLEVTSIQTSSTAPVYVDKSEQKLITYPGATLSFSSFNYKGEWMHAYAFVDYNKDYYFEPVDNNGGTTDGEVVSYNYFNGKTITGDVGSIDKAMAGEYNGSKTLPAFTLPAGLEPGEYRMRIKVDWNNLDADYGASDIAANGGAQCDITLVVEEIVGNEVAKAGLASKIEAAIALFNAVTIGDGVGKYSSSIDDAVAEFLAIQEYYNSITASTPIEEIEAKTARVGEIVASFSLNMPKNGEYFRVAYDYGGTVGKLYMQGVDSEQFKNGQNSYPAKFAADNGAESIWYYYNGALYSYTAGKCIAEKGNDRGLQNIGVKVNATFSASTRAEGKYNIACTSYIHANVTGSNYYTDHCSGNNCVNHDLILEAVTELPVSISAAGKATFFAPVAVEIPTGVKAYTVTINDEWATLNEVEGDVIPANTGVVLEGAPNTYGFAITATEVTAISDLRGSAPATYYTEAGTYYALGVVDDVVAFYKDAFNNSRFQNNSHKAYLYVAEANGVASYSFRFGEGTTGIENVEVENAVKAIYDLTGRKVEAITVPGIYIVNGVKRVVR